jgi:DNA polymerase III subunit gamma/tau
MALYLTYRPQTFDQLVWQEHIANILKPKVASENGTHSNYLFYWPRWTGKTSTARIFAKALNCQNPQNGNPCNTCDSCIAITANKAIDIVEIDAASHTWVDNVREEIIDKAPYPPAQLKKKVYIIDEVHMLSKQAFNALLKIMEEPPKYLVFVLATTEIHKVPETIISRCQIFTFKKLPVDELTNHLRMICTKEWFPFTEEAITSIAKIADWCARDAVKYLDQVSILGEINQEHVTGFLWVASEMVMKNFLQSIINKDLPAAMEAIDILHISGVDINNFIKQCLVHIEEHLEENIPWYLLCAGILKQILYGIKSFPVPTILMKMEVYKAISGEISPSISTSKPSTPVSVPTSIQKPIPAPTETKTNIEESAVFIANETTIPSATTPEIEPIEKTESPKSNNILLTIASHPEIKPNIKSILEKYCLLEDQEWQTILYVFNKLQGTILQKPENWVSVEKSFKQATWSAQWLIIKMISKEEYLTLKL